MVKNPDTFFHADLGLFTLARLLINHPYRKRNLEANMKLTNLNPLKLNTKMAGLALAGLLPLAAHAHDGWNRRGPGANVSGEVQVVHEIPGGVISVGAVFGRRPEPQPQVVVVQDRRPDVVVIEREHGRGRGWEHAHKHAREVTIIRHEERRPRTVIVEQPACNRGETRSHEWSDGRQVSVDRQGPNGNYHYYSDGNQVSEDRQGPNGNYHYYEDAHQVSVQDNRDGHLRNVYVRK
jgi:hypothetical protein